MEQKKREKAVSILDRLFWSVQPPSGYISGDYYRAQMHFAPQFAGMEGHLAVLEVVQRNGKLVMVEFNEINSPVYYIRKHQGINKRYSDYGFFQASKERTASTGVVLVNGLTHLERQMVEQNRLTGAFDLLTGASNSINRAMLPLARQIADRLDAPSGAIYHGLSEEIEPGVTGRLQTVMENGRIIRCHYDEIFADRPEEIEDPELKPYYRQSKYHSPEYVSTIGVGFNAFANLVTAGVLQSQNLCNPVDFPEALRKAGEWGNYLRLAEKLESLRMKD